MEEGLLVSVVGQKPEMQSHDKKKLITKTRLIELWNCFD